MDQPLQRLVARRTKLAFVAEAEGSEDSLFVINPDGTDLHPIDNAAPLAWTWSPNGNHLAYTSNNNEVMIATSDGTTAIPAGVTGHVTDWTETCDIG